ncbi:MAG: extracellular solute-binding protein [Eubacteriales bacterium]
MKKRQRVIALLLSTTMVLGMLSGCGGSSDSTTSTTEATTEATTATTEDSGDIDWITAEDISDMPQTTIRYWYYETPERIALGEEQIERFMELYPNITVEGSTAAQFSDNEMLMQYVNAGTNSNIHQSVNFEDIWYVSNDLLYPLNNFPDFEEFYAQFEPSYNYTWTDGNTYSISWYNSSYCMYYNMDILNAAGITEVPTTYSEYYAMCEAVTDASAKVWAIAPNITDVWWRWGTNALAYYVAAEGNADLVSDDGVSAAVDTEGGLEMYEFFDTIFDEGWALIEEYDSDPFLIGQTASTLGGSDVFKTITTDAASDFNFATGPMLVPDDSDGEGYSTYTFVRNLCIFDELSLEDGEEKDRVRRASWEFLKFILSEEESALDFAATGEMPCYVDSINNPAFTEVFDSYGDQFIQYVEDSSNGTIVDVNSALICDIMDPLQKAIISLAYEPEVTGAEALAEAVEGVNEILAAE